MLRSLSRGIVASSYAPLSVIHENSNSPSSNSSVAMGCRAPFSSAPKPGMKISSMPSSSRKCFGLITKTRNSLPFWKFQWFLPCFVASRIPVLTAREQCCSPLHFQDSNRIDLCPLIQICNPVLSHPPFPPECTVAMNQDSKSFATERFRSSSMAAAERRSQLQERVLDELSSANGRPISGVLDTATSCMIIGPARKAPRPGSHRAGEGTGHLDRISRTRNGCIQ